MKVRFLQEMLNFFSPTSKAALFNFQCSIINVQLPPMNENKIPSGNVTFFFTDIEGSTFQFSMFNFKCSIASYE